MEWLSEIGGIATSFASGGLFGLFGSIVGAVSKGMQAASEHKRKVELMEWDIKMFNKDMESKKLETELEIAITSSAGAWSGLGDSIKADSMLINNTHMWVNDIKSLFRPFLTVMLNVMAGGIFYIMWQAVVDDDGSILGLFTELEIKEILRYTVYSIIFSAATATVWWFGDRALTPPGMKNR